MSNSGIPIGAIALLVSIGAGVVALAAYLDLNLPLLPERASNDNVQDRDPDIQIPDQAVEIASLREIVTQQGAQIQQLSNLVQVQSVRIGELNRIVEQQREEINILKIPTIVGNNLQVSDIIVDQAVGPLITSIKSQVNPALHPIVDLASGAAKAVVEAKLGNPMVRLVSATPTGPNTYSVEVIISAPVRLGEIPGLSAVQNVIGDQTFFVDVTIRATVDVRNQVVSNVQYVTTNIRV